jgi:hypothetical protein
VNSDNRTELEPESISLHVHPMRQQSLTLSAQVNGCELAPGATRDLLACLQDHITHRPSIHVRARIYTPAQPTPATLAAWIAAELNKNEIWD